VGWTLTPRKILHIITQLELGGAQRSTLQILARLDRRRYAPTLISSNGPLSHEARQIPGLTVHLWPTLRRQIHPLADGVAFARLTSFIRREQFHLVHTHSSKAGILGRWAAHAAHGPAIVHTIHGFAFHAYQTALVRRGYQQLERLTSRITDRLIVVSEHDRRAGLDAGIGHPSQYRLIRYGVEARRVATDGARQSVREELGITPTAPLIGTVACLKPQKAPLDFVRACRIMKRELPEAHFVLIGDGTQRPRVERWRRRFALDDSLHLLGWRRDVPRLLSALDVFVLASRWEGLPIACLEAKAAGLPIVATSVGGVPEVVANGVNGLLVPPARPEQLASVVIDLLHHDEARNRFGEASYASLDGACSIERMVTQTEELYETLLNHGGR